MLDRAPPIGISERVSRVALPPAHILLQRQLRKEIDDEREFAEALEALGGPEALSDETITDMAGIPFRSPSQGRYSDGAHGVLYTARGHRTASREAAHSQRPYYNPPAGSPYAVRYPLLSWMLDGNAKDIRRFLKKCPWLISDDHTLCRELGARARAEGLTCLIAPSARHRPRGVTVPVFVEGAVSQGRADGEVIFWFSSEAPVRYRTKFN
jgi:hypothetical protein